jgi:hypothetical protein
MRALPGRVYRPQLLFRASRDGFKPKDFHAKCDGKGPTIVIIQADGLGKGSGTIVFYAPDKGAWNAESTAK